MSYLALYRKYRPTTFDGLIGQDHIVRILKNQIENDKIGHAYLFTGTRGTGKTSVAKIFAKAINCTSRVDGSPCGQCEVCKALSDPSNIDILEIDAASNNGVNEIRDLREKVQYPPVSCRYKVYIIDEVHMLTGAAFNALLKTLEEPPRHAVFILATTEVHKIPATILSRCMRFDFRLVATELIAEHIAKIYDEQGKSYDKEAVYQIAVAGEGSIRDALSIADTCMSYSTGKLTYDDVSNILGTSNSGLILDFCESVLLNNSGKVLETINDLVSIGKNIGVLIKDITLNLRNMIIAKTCQNPNKILNLPQDKFNRVSDIASKTTEERLVRVLEIFADAENLLKYSITPRTVFETAAIKGTRPESDYNIDALLARITELEKQVKEKTVFTAVDVNSNATKTNNSESVVEKRVEKLETQKDISELSEQELKSKLLINLRKADREMLWYMAQKVNVKGIGSVLNIYVDDSDDFKLLSMQSSIDDIKNAMQEFGDISVVVSQSGKGKTENKIDEETDKIKKIFGDDIVILKD